MTNKPPPRVGHVNADHLWYGATEGKAAALDDIEDSLPEESYIIAVIKKIDYDNLQAELDELHQKMLSAQPYYYNEWQKLQSRLEKCEVLLTKAGTVIGDVPWSGPCKELDVLHSIDDYFAEVEGGK